MKGTRPHLLLLAAAVDKVGAVAEMRNVQLLLFKRHSSIGTVTSSGVLVAVIIGGSGARLGRRSGGVRSLRGKTGGEGCGYITKRMAAWAGAAG